MKSNVYFLWDNKVQVQILDDEEVVFEMIGPREVVEQSLRRAVLLAKKVLVGLLILDSDQLKQIAERSEVFEGALAKLLYTPISWD